MEIKMNLQIQMSSDDNMVTFFDCDKNQAICEFDIGTVLDSIYLEKIRDPTGIWPFLAGYIFGRRPKKS